MGMTNPRGVYFCSGVARIWVVVALHGSVGLLGLASANGDNSWKIQSWLRRLPTISILKLFESVLV
jgi:hypothetical protein